VFPVREALEVVAVRLAISNLAKDPSALTAALEGMRAAARARDAQAFAASDAAFHRAIVEAARNASLLDAYNALSIEGKLLSVLSSEDVDLSELAESHVPLLRALQAGKMGEAVKQLRSHWADIVRGMRYRERIRRRP
jgi:DNA-binding GntR family transcriptional regulator